MTTRVSFRELIKRCLSIGIVIVALGLILGIGDLSLQAHAQTEPSNLPSTSWLRSIIQSFTEHFGALFIATIAGIIAIGELRAQRRTAERVAIIEQERLRAEQEAAANRAKLEEQRFKVEQVQAEKRAELEERRYEAEAEERAKVRGFRDQELQRFSKPAAELAKYLSGFLADDPRWAHSALEAAKLLPYARTLFGERLQHFREEKEELAKRFTPYLLKRCEALTSNGRHVFLLIDAGTTLYPLFELIGTETMKQSQEGADWLSRLHLATNNLPGIEQLMKTGKRAPWNRYSKLAIEDCHLLPGVPIPIFAAVAGEETNEAIRRFRSRPTAYHGELEVTFVALVVGNWVRIRTSEPRCPVPMARGIEHVAVKQTFVENADEIFVISPLGKIFVGNPMEEINAALGFSAASNEMETEEYRELQIDNEQAQRVKLVATTRADGRLLHRHSNRVEDSLGWNFGSLPARDEFAVTSIREAPHLLFPFAPSQPRSTVEESVIELPHEHTRTNRKVLDMFGIDPRVI